MHKEKQTLTSAKKFLENFLGFWLSSIKFCGSLTGKLLDDISLSEIKILALNDELQTTLDKMKFWRFRVAFLR